MTEEKALKAVDASELTTQNTSKNKPKNPGFGSTDVKDFDVVSDDHHAVQEIGASALRKKTDDGAAKFLSEFIYEHDKAWVREWLQNHEAACVRRAKFLIRLSDKFEDGWLTHTMWVNSETGETVIDFDDPQSCLAEYDESIDDVRELEVPRPIGEVLEAARTLGYDPTITWDVYRDERQIVTEDNGDGMTPTEFDEHFNTVFGSKSKHDSETGGMIGIGSESSAILHGEEGGMTLETRSTVPTEDGELRPGFRAYSYLGGGNILPGEVEDGFVGARFNIPIKKDFDISNLQGWVEEFTEALRVPMLYREHDAGETPVEEEYEAAAFSQRYSDAPILINRPGEFAVAAGPNVIPSTSYSEPDPPDTFLVSMPIDRNTRASVNTFWDVVIQIHDEQGRVIAGPNRGKFWDDLDEPHEDDVALPEPTGDRDRLQQEQKAKDFFKYVQSEVKELEIAECNSLIEEMNESEHPGQVIRGNPEDWAMFKKMVNYYGSYNITDKEMKFKKFLRNRDELPDIDDDNLDKMWSLFQTLQYCNAGTSSARKKYRKTMKLGDFLGVHGDGEVFMAASTSGNFKKYFQVARETFDDMSVVVVKSSRDYRKFKENFGFRKLKNVPLTQNDDHGFYVPDSIHESQQKKQKSKKSRGKADNIEDRVLKLRTDGESSAIDARWKIKKIRAKLEAGNPIQGHSKLVLYCRAFDDKISEGYDMADYAAIASASKTEYEALSDLDAVMTPDEFKEWSRSAVIGTEEGAMTPKELVDDDRLVILAFRERGYTEAVKIAGNDGESDELAALREFYLDDIRSQMDWARKLDGYDGGYRGDTYEDIDEDDLPEMLMGVIDTHVINRSHYAFSELDFMGWKLTGMRLGGRYRGKFPLKFRRISGNQYEYRAKAKTPNWSNDSEVYSMLPNDLDSFRGQLFMGFHDRGVDPTKFEEEEVRQMVNGTL